MSAASRDRHPLISPETGSAVDVGAADPASPARFAPPDAAEWSSQAGRVFASEIAKVSSGRSSGRILEDESAPHCK